MRYSLRLLAALAAAAAAAVVAVGALAGGRDSAPGWSLVWSDEFTGAAGAPPDPARWGYDRGGDWGAELEYYTDRAANVRQNGAGELEIVGRRERFEGHDYTSGRILTRGLFARAYGRFEARIEIPYGQGTWPAFWMLGASFDKVGWPRCGEIDVMEEIGREPTTVYGSIHGQGYIGALISSAYTLPLGRLTDGYHLYAIEWSPKGIAWYLDDVRYAWKTPADLPPGTRWAFDHPFFLILNLAIGGDWPGSPDASTPFPATMLVDFVHVYARSGPDTEPPDPPSELRALRRGARTATLTWSMGRDEFGVTRYLIFLGEKQVGSTRSTRFVLRRLKPRTTYRVFVRAEDAAGNVSAPAAARVRTCPASGRC
jgi:beta-glucanase (GH16 family)